MRVRRAVEVVRARRVCPPAAVQGAAEAVVLSAVEDREAAGEAVVDHAVVAVVAGGSHENIQNINI